MSSTVTVTGKIGPGNTLTSQVFHNVSSFRVDTINNLIWVAGSETSGVETSIDITDASTFTVTKSGSNYTVTVS